MPDSISPDNEAVQPPESEPGEIITPDPAPDTEVTSLSTETTKTEGDPKNEDVAEPTDNFKIDQEVVEQPDSSETISWTAPEFVAHEKSTGWYLAIVLGAVVIGFLAWLFTKSVFPVVVIILATAIFVYSGSHKPRELNYEINEAGLQIENKSYSYNDFKSFSVLPEGHLSSIIFLPFKRFLPPLTIYVEPDDEEKVVSVIATRIPVEPGRRDAVDRLITRIRF